MPETKSGSAKTSQYFENALKVSTALLDINRSRQKTGDTCLWGL